MGLHTPGPEILVVVVSPRNSRSIGTTTALLLVSDEPLTSPQSICDLLQTDPDPNFNFLMAFNVRNSDDSALFFVFVFCFCFSSHDQSENGLAGTCL